MPGHAFETTPKILYIEDNCENRILVRAVLEPAGYTLVEADDGLAGIEAAIREEPALILLDINLPSVDGYEVVGMLKSFPNLTATPVIAVTAYTMEGDRQRTLVAGCDGYIQKPIDVDAFPRQVAEFLRGKRESVESREEGIYLRELNQRLVYRLLNQVEELKRLNQELVRKNAELDSFVYTVTHDLKAPLVTIQGMSNLVLEEHAGRLDADGRHYLERIQANTGKMERLLLDLLALSRIGREARPMEEVHLGELVHEILVDLADRLRASGIKVVVGDLPSIWAVRVQMEQVFRNLVTNAIRYMGDGPAPTIEIGTIGRGAELECWVRDTGIGIDPAFHEKIFKIFQRLAEVEVEGTGVGLAIVKKIVEAAGGRVWVESVRGHGSTFRFTWPATSSR